MKEGGGDGMNAGTETSRTVDAAFLVAEGRTRALGRGGLAAATEAVGATFAVRTREERRTRRNWKMRLRGRGGSNLDVCAVAKLIYTVGATPRMLGALARVLGSGERA